MPWSDKQLKSHKKAQAGISVAGATLGIGALGTVGARAGAPKFVKLAQRAGKLRNVTPEGVKHFRAKSSGVATGLTTGSAGIGGVGGYNFAGIQMAESKRRPQVATVKKADSRGSVAYHQKKRRNSEDRGLAGLGAAVAFGGTSGLSLAGNPQARSQSRTVLRATHQAGRNAKRDFRWQKPGGPKVHSLTSMTPRGSLKTLGRTALHNPLGAGAVGLGALGAAGATGWAAERGVQAHHTRAIRASKVKKMDGGMDFGIGQVRQGTGVSKAYSPERNRKRRLDAYSAGAGAASVGLAGGAGAMGYKTGKKARGAIGMVNQTGGKTAFVDVAQLKSLRKPGAVTAGLGLGAIGAAAGAEGIRRYKERGAGRSYRPLH